MKQRVVLFLDYLYDLRRFWRHSGFGKGARKSAAHLQAELMIEAHGLEKCLAFADFELRRGIGKLKAAQRLLAAASRAGLPEDDTAVCMAKAALANYRQVHAAAGDDLRDVLDPSLALPDAAPASLGQSLRQPCVAPSAAMGEALLAGMLSRASVREYAATPITREEVEAVVRGAMATPSVCNRQGYRAHFTVERAVIDAALACQNGNRGFGERVPGLFVVTSDLGIFSGPSERNQAFVDGGLFAMSLMLSLHAHGFGSCPLNWSASYRQDQRLRQAVSIPAAEAIVMMISFGHYAPDTRAAGSRRYPLDHVLQQLRERQGDSQ